jgi:predicted DNA-binding antitoxin AbrB/MazE fold protein
MIKTVEATYENGVLKLPEPLALPEKTRVMVTIEAEFIVSEDAERNLWLNASQQALSKTWDNSADDIFNELLKR